MGFKLIFTALFASFITSAFSQGDLAPKYSNEFLSIGIGAGALGKSNAVVAGVNDVTAGYWNPAGLTEVSDFLQIGAMHAEYFAGISKFDYVGLAKPINTGVGGFSFIRFAVDDIPNTTQLIDNNGNIDYDRITRFTAGDYAFLFSYAQKIQKIENLSVGGSFKIIYRHVGNFANAFGFGIDAGANYKLGNKWRFGAMVRDVTSTFNAWQYNLDSATIETFLVTGNEIPEGGLELTLPKVILGAAFKTPIKNEFYFSSEINFDLNTDGRRNVLIRTRPVSIDPHLGIEFGYGKFAAVRMGMGNLQWVKNADLSESISFQPNIGLGIGFKSVNLDYAFTDIGDASVALYSHVFSLKIGLKNPPKKAPNNQ
ncbi:MAG: hypothetical protein AB8B74_08065 [Crocinitomicaceae bacterium]